MWRSDRNRMACIANGSKGVAHNAIRPGTERRVSQASPSERKRIFSGRIWSPTERYLIGLDRRFTKCWLAICSH